MAIKKSDLYSSLWASCDELRGGMDASQYKDYVLFMLFIKYISDKYAGSDEYAPPVVIPPGASFADMIQLKGKSDIGDKINKQVIQPLVDANARLARTDFPDFNDENKLGEGPALVERLTNLISIFQKPELDFSHNRADHDDILGDAYEYLMRNFAQDSGKSKGQFYTPAEVSRVIAKVIGIGPHNTVAATTCHDPTCGSGSLLLKVAAEAGKQITLEGQEKDVTTAGLARMNMILHNFPTANIQNGNTLAAPKFKDGDRLRTYDYVVANPPFSDKSWSTGFDPSEDPYARFAWGAPPAKQGDYAYLLHIIRSMKSTGKAACILPHGVLFRGNAEGAIRRHLVQSGILKGIIGLPPNLFYGTGIPACILVLDKENAQARRGVYLIDASKGLRKDGNKNRLREQDIHRIVDAFRRGDDIRRFARMVPYDEIAGPKNDYNLNLPRYIDSSEPEDIQDIAGHLHGGIPARDIAALGAYWEVLPALRDTLLADLGAGAGRQGYYGVRLPAAEVKPAVLQHPDFGALRADVEGVFGRWRAAAVPHFKGFDAGGDPKQLIGTVAEALLGAFQAAPLVDAYGVYQHLMDFWAEGMQDDCYLIAADGWVAKTHRLCEEGKGSKNKGEWKDRGWACDLVPKPLIVARYFAAEQRALDDLGAELEAAAAALAELSEEYGGEGGVLEGVANRADAEAALAGALAVLWAEEDPAGYAAWRALADAAEAGAAQLAALSSDPHLAPLKGKGGKLALKAVKDRLAAGPGPDERAALRRYVEAEAAYRAASSAASKQLEGAEARYRGRLAADFASAAADLGLYTVAGDLFDLRAAVRYLDLLDRVGELRKEMREADASLDKLAYEKYPQLGVEEIKTLVVEDKWLPALAAAVEGELDRLAQALAGRIRQLAERYATPLPQLVEEVDELSARVEGHLRRMGAVWN